MKFLYKYGTRTNEIRRAKRELYLRLATVMAILFFFVIMVLIAKFRPRLNADEEAALPDTANVGDPMANPRLMEMREAVDRLLEEYSSRKEESIDLKDMELLREAISTQRRIISYRGSEIAPLRDLERMEALQTLYDDEMGSFLAAQSKRLEEEATLAWESGETDVAIQKITRSVNLQEEINSQYPRSSDRDPTRLYSLKNQQLAWQTEPMAAEADQLKEEAYQLVQDRHYAEAKRSIARALNLQKTLNQEFRNSRLASLARLKQFEEAYRFVQTAEDRHSVEILVREGRQAMEAGDADEAQAKAERAAVLQRKILEASPGMKDELTAELDLIERLRETAASLPTYERIQDFRHLTHQALLARDTEAFRQAVGQWQRQADQMEQAYPRSELAANLNKAEIAFLSSQREEIPAILEIVHDNLVPVPGQPGTLLYRTEVPQVLYSQIAGTNPSNVRLPSNPIESITWQEAHRFMERLGWILVRPVSLPTREVYQQAIGEARLEDLATQAWSMENSNREPRPVGTAEPNSHGFHDLLGNVSEWLAGEGTGTEAVAIGGSARDARFRLATVPEESRSKTERNRFVGFRFMVGSED